MKIKGLVIICLFFIVCHQCTSAQSRNINGGLIFEGQVYGYEYDATRKLLKKNKQTVLEGILEGVLVSVYTNDKILSKTISNQKGEFRFILKPGEVYRMELSKEGYDKNILWIDTKGIPLRKSGDKLKFSGAEFVLNSFKIKNNINLNEPVGTLYYNDETGGMDFKINENRSKKARSLGKKDEQDNLVELMKRAVLKNKKNSKSAPLSKEKIKAGVSKDSSSPHIPETKNNITVNNNNTISEFKLAPNKGIKQIIENDIINRGKEIRESREQLEEDKLKALTKADSLLLQQREAIINAAELELESARILIDVQESKIKIQSKVLYLSFGGLVILLGLLSVIYVHYKEKARTNRLLETKNKKILDSINYARRIQQSILIGEKEIQKFLPDSFIYYCPKDIVSGDFYWFSELNGKLVIAVVDCTGHGVPGAFMSLIGNTLLNQIVNEKHILDPAAILNYLHADVLKVLHQEESDDQSQDGMEIALCIIDRKNNTIEYAGAMNPLYLVHNNVLNVISADTQSIGGKTLRPGKGNTLYFTSQTIPLQKNTCVYMFTDGYMDQFGGANNKKFNTTNFKQLLLGIQKMNMKDQKEAIHVAMQNWKREYHQIDDMLVAGFKI